MAWPATIETLDETFVDTDVSATAHPLHHSDAGRIVNATMVELGASVSGTAVDLVTRLNLRQTVKKTADQAITVQTLTNVTDLAVVLLANTDYRFGFTMVHNGGTARGVGYGLTFSGTVTRLTALVSMGGATAPATGSTDAHTEGTIQASGGSITTAAMNATSNFMGLIEGILQVGATGGTLQVQARQGTGTTAANMNVLKGSFGYAEA